MLIDITTDAVKKRVNIQRTVKDGTFSVVGVLGSESVAIEIPTVENPEEQTDAHWTPAKYDSTTIVLDADNNILGLPFAGLVRINKPDSPGNPFGVDHK